MNTMEAKNKIYPAYNLEHKDLFLNSDKIYEFSFDRPNWFFSIIQESGKLQVAGSAADLTDANNYLGLLR